MLDKTDEEIVRAALEFYDKRSAQTDMAYDALAALDRVLSRTLPESPEGWNTTVLGS
jgi:hypothetical protein